MLGFLEEEPGWARLLLIELPCRARPRREQALTELAQSVSRMSIERLLDAEPVPSQAVAERLSREVFSVLRANTCQHAGTSRWEVVSWFMRAVIEPRLAQTASQGIGETQRQHRASALPKASDAPGAATVLRVVARLPRSSNTRVAQHAGVANGSNVREHLRRLERQGLVRNLTSKKAGLPNAWVLTAAGRATMQLDSGERFE